MFSSSIEGRAEMVTFSLLVNNLSHWATPKNTKALFVNAQTHQFRLSGRVLCLHKPPVCSSYGCRCNCLCSHKRTNAPTSPINCGLSAGVLRPVLRVVLHCAYLRHLYVICIPVPVRKIRRTDVLLPKGI